jgi:hypothetical protein
MREVGFRDTLRPAGITVAERLTGPLKPLRLVRVTSDEFDGGRERVRGHGLALMEKSCSGGWDRVNLLVCIPWKLLSVSITVKRTEKFPEKNPEPAPNVRIGKGVNIFVNAPPKSHSYIAIPLFWAPIAASRS